jgi:predicted RNA-binding Zn ribbon-like protein
LHRYADLARWARHVGMLDEERVAALLRAAAADPDGAAATFARALDLRAALTALFRALARGAAPRAAALATTRAAYLDALAHADLAPGADGYRWTWPDGAALDRPLWSVAASAIALLTEGDPARIKECPGADDCGWLFYDTSKNGSRRWCSMEGCGSRVKMRHQYARKRERGGRG